jgi:hypothetical protein
VEATRTCSNVWPNRWLSGWRRLHVKGESRGPPETRKGMHDRFPGKQSWGGTKLKRLMENDCRHNILVRRLTLLVHVHLRVQGL